MNKQREVIYGFRNEIIHGDDVRDRLIDIMEEVVLQKVEEFSSRDTEVSEWNVRGLADWVNLTFPLGMTEAEITKAANSGNEEPVSGSLFDGLSAAQFAVCQFISDKVRDAYKLKISVENVDQLKTVERYTILSAIDRLWQEHLYGMDSLRTSIGLRAYGQRDPLLEYKKEAFEMFEELTRSIREETVRNLFRAALVLEPVPGRGLPPGGPLGAGAPPELPRILPGRPQAKPAPRQQEVHAEVTAFGTMAEPQEDAGASQRPGGRSAAPPPRPGAAPPGAKQAPVVSTEPKVGRNDPCPCGSGKKYKKCHGAN